MIIDDDRNTIKVTAYGLQKHGFQVVAFNDAEYALSQYKPKQYDIILLDVRIAPTDGFDVAKQIWYRDPDAKIGFFSAFDIYENEAKTIFKDLKSSMFIKKPIEPDELAQVIEAQLRPSK